MVARRKPSILCKTKQELVVPHASNQIKLTNKYIKFVGGGKVKIKVATSTNRRKWVTSKKTALERRKGYFDSGSLHIFDALKTEEGAMLFYYTKKPFVLGAALFSKDNPEEIIWRSAEPIWESAEKITPLKVSKSKRTVTIHLQTGKSKKTVKFSLDYLFGIEESPRSILNEVFAPVLSRAPQNPILKPNSKLHWESCATFNTGAVYLDGKVHFIYRAIGANGASVLGYASSEDGIHIGERLSTPVYVPTEPFECQRDDNSPALFSYSSGYGWGGCEDPRLVKIDDTIYMTYTAYNGCEPPGVALTSIKVKDFLRKNWKWEKPILISPRREIHKNWVLLPKKINGKFAIIHSISPEILVDYLDDLNFINKKYITSFHASSANISQNWDNQLRGIGPPPIETKEGWLVFYHAMDRYDPNRYKIGAMMLDKNDPTKILYKSAKPILAPDKTYENVGFKPNVIYSCGAVVIGENLIVYYGGADTVVCAASANFAEFLMQLKNSRSPTQGVITTVL